MLLRRVIDHVREQNWFAVGIDFVIAVVGVYIGIEVANWNDARRDRVAEALYLDRLDREIAATLPEAEATQVTGRQAEILTSLGRAVASGLPGRPLNAAAQDASEKRP